VPGAGIEESNATSGGYTLSCIKNENHRQVCGSMRNNNN
jgi:hypothetical protein